MIGITKEGFISGVNAITKTKYEEAVLKEIYIMYVDPQLIENKKDLYKYVEKIYDDALEMIADKALSTRDSIDLMKKLNNNFSFRIIYFLLFKVGFLDTADRVYSSNEVCEIFEFTPQNLNRLERLSLIRGIPIGSTDSKVVTRLYEKSELMRYADTKGQDLEELLKRWYKIQNMGNKEKEDLSSLSEDIRKTSKRIPKIQ